MAYWWVVTEGPSCITVPRGLLVL